ncbi:MAG: respiratory chain complex I subunit 1 family protein [Chloroflexota bacterium]
MLVLLTFSPLISGIIARAEAWLQSRRGPSFLQPYYDIAKFFKKDRAVPAPASWIFVAAPIVSFGCYCAIATLIPVLTTYPLPLAWMGDILGGAFLFGLSGFFLALAALDSGSPYTGIGSSRAVFVGALAEPTLIFVFFTVALITHTDLPYAMAATVQSSLVQVLRPAHLLVVVALFMMILVDTGRIPIENHGSTLEFGLIDEGRVFEHSGPDMALVKWGSSMKQFLLFVILLNVLVAPWGLATTLAPVAVGIAVATLLLKMILLGLVIVGIECSFAKLRLFKIPEFMAAGFLMSVLAILIFYLGGG